MSFNFDNGELHPRLIARNQPDKTALIFADTGREVSYGELESNINRCAHLLHDLGLRPGDAIAASTSNTAYFIELCWAALNSGLYFVPLNPQLKPAELSYLVENCEAKAFFCDQDFTEEKAQVLLNISSLSYCFSDGFSSDIFKDLTQALADKPTLPLSREVRGEVMMYSSGTTGKPKGIRPKANLGSIFEAHQTQKLLIDLYHFTKHSVYLSTAPLYHAAPLKFILAVTLAGGTSVIMTRFDAQRSLELIAQYQVTHSQWVPTMFVRLLALPLTIRQTSDCSSLRYAIHAAAPCPEKIKRQMFDWWGPVIYEYYGGSEGVGMCAITPEEWLKKPGSVGKAVRGEIHILDDQGNECPNNQVGTVYFSGGRDFQYFKDPQKTAQITHPKGWRTMGDLGFVDDEGYLFLADRRDNLIISGGVNIYPQEVEDLLITHPKVFDVAVIGVPCEEFGQQVKAIIQLKVPADYNPLLEEEFKSFCLNHLARYKCPKQFGFMDQLPRQANGKLFKRLLIS